jgi:TRAP-type C4-dicarboxylate transport system permease small subunit
MGKAEKIFDVIEILVSCTAFSVMVLMVAVNVFTRYVLGYSFGFSEEIAYLGFTYAVFFGICIVYKKKAMVAIDILVDHLPARVQAIVEIAVYGLLSLINAVMLYYSVKLSISAYSKLTSYLNMPYTYMDLAAVFGFALLTFYSVKFLIGSIRGKRYESVALENRY